LQKSKYTMETTRIRYKIILIELTKSEKQDTYCLLMYYLFTCLRLRI
jgi:hypothetical protein